MDPYGVINGSLIHNGPRESIHIHSNQPVDGNNFGGVWPLTIPLADPENGCCPRQPNVPNTRWNWRHWNWLDPWWKTCPPPFLPWILLFPFEHAQILGTIFRFLSTKKKKKKLKIENFQWDLEKGIKWRKITIRWNFCYIWKRKFIRNSYCFFFFFFLHKICISRLSRVKQVWTRSISSTRIMHEPRGCTSRHTCTNVINIRVYSPRMAQWQRLDIVILHFERTFIKWRGKIHVYI